MPNPLSMLGNYLTTGIQSVLRQKVHLALNLFGLALGLAAALLILIFVYHEQNFDRMHPKAEDTYRLEQLFVPLNQRFPVTSPAMKPLLQSFDDRIQVTRLSGFGDATVQLDGSALQLSLQNAYMAEANLVEFFQFETVSGNLDQALSHPNQIALSEKEALRLYGKTDILGQQLQLGNERYNIAAIYRVPEQSHLLLGSLRRQDDKTANAGLATNSVYTYLQLPAALDQEKLLSTLTEQLNTQAYNGQNMSQLQLRALTDIHLHSALSYELKVNGSVSTVHIALVLAILLLGIAAINFINMSTARAGQRAKEVGVRKALGATRSQLFCQFMLESVLIACCAGLLAAVLVELLLPEFNALVNRELVLSYSSSFGVILLATVITVGLAAGIFPAVFISAFDAKKVLSGDFQRGKTAIWLRKALLILQGAISIGLLVSTGVLEQQLHLLQQQSTGYQRDSRLMVHQLPNNDLFFAENDSMLQSLKTLPGVKHASLLDMQLTGTISQAMVIRLPGQTEDKNLPPIPQMGVGFDIVKTAGFTLLAGRDFSAEFQSDWYKKQEEYATASVIINESLARQAGYSNMQDVIGQKWLLPDNRPILRMTVVGVIADVQIGAATRQPEPLLLICGRSAMSNANILLQIEPAQALQSRQAVEQLLRERLLRQDLKLSWLNDDYHAMYQNQQRQSNVITIFAALAMTLTCVGLFGLAAFSAEQRSREVAMRKILGADKAGLVQLLANEYLQLMTVSAVLAIPATWWLLRDWLSEFTVRVSQSPLLYLLAVAITFAICWTTVAVLAWQVASKKPATVLRHQ